MVVINPVAGKDQPVLKVINTVFKAAGADWDVRVTKEAGDGQRFAQEAIRLGADVVAVNGGDGTVMEVANGLAGSPVPFAILPGGTANVMSLELGIPNDLFEACALAADPHPEIRVIDMGKIGEQYFLTRLSMGLPAAMVEGADREAKDRLGVFAYALAGLQSLANPPVARYSINIDGQEVESEGLTCIIANSGMMGVSGMPGLSMAPNISLNDGLLDVIVLTKADLPSLLSLAVSVMGGSENERALQHWQARQVTVAAGPIQTVQLDGELLGQTPVSVEVAPGAVCAIVPARQP
jgi:YegS/Rv2252/BmrU family lipid kinase